MSARRQEVFPTKRAVDFDALLESGKTITLNVSRDEANLGADSPSATPRQSPLISRTSSPWFMRQQDRNAGSPSSSPFARSTPRMPSSPSPFSDEPMDEHLSERDEDLLDRYADATVRTSTRAGPPKFGGRGHAANSSTSTSSSSAKDLAELARRAEYASRNMSDAASISSGSTAAHRERAARQAPAPLASSSLAVQSSTDATTRHADASSSSSSARTTLAGTMRKTSKFFKKLGTKNSTSNLGKGVSSADMSPATVDSATMLGSVDKDLPPPMNHLVELTYKDSTRPSPKPAPPLTPKTVLRVKQSPGKPPIPPRTPNNLQFYEDVATIRSRTAPNTPISKHDPPFPKAATMVRSSSGDTLTRASLPSIEPRRGSLTNSQRSVVDQSPPASTVSADDIDAPAIRLVSASTTFPNLRDMNDVSNDTGHSTAPVGLGVGLDPIVETRSREASASSATAVTAPGTPEPSPQNAHIPVFVTHSPAEPAPPSKRELARRSVVTFPAVSPFARPGSRNDSQSSLYNGTMKRSSSKRSELDIADDATPEQVEEKAAELADKCWEEDESVLSKRKMAEWLGSLGRLNAATLRHYINHFDFANLRLDVAFRRLCQKLYLKAETQQIDRILAQFSERYWQQNPDSVYGAADIVHAVSYSLLLLNTDLHVVDSTTRMSRQQFVRNTVSAIKMQSNTSEELEESQASPMLAKLRAQGIGSSASNGSSRSLVGAAAAAGMSRSRSGGLEKTPRPDNASTTSFKLQSEGALPKGIDEAALENTLKEIYSAIKMQPIFQPSTDPALSLPNESRNSLSPGSGSAGNTPYGTWSGVSRQTSRRSAASTVSGASSAWKRTSVRGIGSLLGASRSDFMRSPSPTPSTTTSLSEDYMSTAFGASSVHASSIGFAGTLSNSIIKEQQEDEESDSEVSISDEELALLGAPWAKEGILQRKHYWESAGKRSKDKAWLQVFVVIGQGELQMYRFDGTGGSVRMSGGGGLGGGNWATNAQTVGSVSLAHALCSAMPAPGYNRNRPHCFVLTSANGGSYFFQAGTPDLVMEWVSTCNYWAARLSKEPLSGGVSNMEYGWNRVEDVGEAAAASSSSTPDAFDKMSIRSGHSRRAGSIYASQSINPNDRIHINDWTAPQQPSATSTLSEEAQLENLKRHLSIVQSELVEHNSIRGPMTKLYTPRSANASKAFANWERKSQYLLAEIVKYQTYIDALSNAIKLRLDRRSAKQVELMLREADGADLGEPTAPAYTDDDGEADADDGQDDGRRGSASERAQETGMGMDTDRLSGDMMSMGERPGTATSRTAPTESTMSFETTREGDPGDGQSP